GSNLEMSIRRLTRTVALLDGLGSVGALLMAFAAPCCLPLFAMIAGAVGITALGLNEKFVLFALQAFAVIAVIGLAFAASRLRQFGPSSSSAACSRPLFSSSSCCLCFTTGSKDERARQARQLPELMLILKSIVNI